LSTRLGDITKTVPKVLLDIGGNSVLDWQLAKLKKAGIDTVVLAAGHLADILQKEAGRSLGGMDLVYAVEQERPGTGGAIKNALQYVKDKDAPTIILNGDVLTSVNIGDMISRVQHDSEGMILGSLVPDASSYGTLLYDEQGHLKEFREKEGKAMSGHINGGIYILTPKAAQHFPEERVFSVEYDVFPKMKDLYVHASEDPWVDIGVPERLAWARENWRLFL
jgi:NDP-sugar pyrophosphorylase family protein